jgi:hypothetical protein
MIDLSINFNLENNLTWLKMMRESSGSPCAKKSEFLVNSDRFSKYLKYLRNFEKRSKLTKNSDFFARGEHATLSHQFEQKNTLIEPNFQ